MKAFFDGMSRLNLFPYVKPVDSTTAESAWRGVASAFFQAGNNLRAALHETEAAADSPDEKFKPSKTAL